MVLLLLLYMDVLAIEGWYHIRKFIPLGWSVILFAIVVTIFIVIVGCGDVTSSSYVEEYQKIILRRGLKRYFLSHPRVHHTKRSVNTTREGRHVGQTRRRFNSRTARERSGSAMSMYKTSVFVVAMHIPRWHLLVTELLWTQQLIHSTVTSLDNADTHNRRE